MEDGKGRIARAPEASLHSRAATFRYSRTRSTARGARVHRDGCSPSSPPAPPTAPVGSERAPFARAPNAVCERSPSICF